jgi:hypothetical protein
VTAGTAIAGLPGPAPAGWDGAAERQARDRLWQDLLARYPPRPGGAAGDAASQDREQILSRLSQPPFALSNPASQRYRMRGTACILGWLADQPGSTWQQRWAVAEARLDPETDWRLTVSAWLKQRGLISPCRRREQQVVGGGLLPLVCGDVVRPGLRWLLSVRTLRDLAAEMARIRDPGGFAVLAAVCQSDSTSPEMRAAALRQIAVVMAAKGGMVAGVSVGDCLELLHVGAEVSAPKQARSPYFYQVLHAAGFLPADAPATSRAFRTQGQLTPGQLTDRYGIECQPVRDLLVDYLRERQPRLDYNSLRHLAHALGRLFWRDLEVHHPGIDSLRLPAHVVSQWRERLLAKTIRRRGPDGQVTETQIQRGEVLNQLTAVRAFYLDIAEWAAEDPARWGPWAAPCPIRAEDMARKGHLSRRKARMDQRTRERMPVLPQLAAAVAAAAADTAERLHAARQATPGQVFTAAGQTLRRAVLTTSNNARIWAEDPATGRRRDLTLDEHRAFWTWATVEVLRHTGIRLEELRELSHHSLVQYRLPGTGELIPLLQIAPSKTDTERLLVISPELADVLSAIICRIRDRDGAVPLVVAYDPGEKVWMPPMPLLFQRHLRAENRPITAHAIRGLLAAAIESPGITDVSGAPLHYAPHDFRRLFLTDAIMHGMPPHIAQLVAGHADINTTMGYKAVYPEEVINGHRAFIARRRELRPAEEYRIPTDAEWEAFLGHFEHRKLSLGTCGRSYGTPCIHEHSCIRCPLLRPDPAQRQRLLDIRANLVSRIEEAARHGWAGEAEGLKISLAAAGHKLAQMDQITASRSNTVHLGLPAFTGLAGRTVTTESISGAR